VCENSDDGHRHRFQPGELRIPRRPPVNDAYPMRSINATTPISFFRDG
jgi:hypothetical protein